MVHIPVNRSYIRPLKLPENLVSLAWSVFLVGGGGALPDTMIRHVVESLPAGFNNAFVHVVVIQDTDRPKIFVQNLFLLDAFQNVFPSCVFFRKNSDKNYVGLGA